MSGTSTSTLQRGRVFEDGKELRCSEALRSAPPQIGRRDRGTLEEGGPLLTHACITLKGIIAQRVRYEHVPTIAEPYL